MSRSKTITLEDLGEVLIEKSSRARRLNISVKPFRGVRVAVPENYPLQVGEKMARDNVAWIERQLSRIRAVENQIEQAEFTATEINRPRATRMLTDRLAALASQHGFSYNKVTVRNQKTRWGSCSSRGNISLNIQLCNLPSHLVDYVLLHELVHLRIAGHGPDFWQEMVRLMPKARTHRAELKSYRLYRK